MTIIGLKFRDVTYGDEMQVVGGEEGAYQVLVLKAVGEDVKGKTGETITIPGTEASLRRGIERGEFEVIE